MKTKLKETYEYKYGYCNSCKNCTFGKKGWLVWCNKFDKPISIYNRCYLYKVKRRYVK